MASFDATFRIPGCRCERSTDKAILVRMTVNPDFAAGIKNPMWFPLSQVDDDSEVYSQHDNENTGTLIVSEWIAKQKGLTE